jgi:TatD DNase family protein
VLYIDIHTHKQNLKTTSIVNWLNNFSQLPANGFYSVGIHPWYINTETEKELTELTTISQQTNVLAIGECGLDKVCNVNFTLQQTYFLKQIQLANTLQKPLIIHCVRAFNEVVQVLEEQKVNVPVVFHGFNKKHLLAQSLIAKGYYLSFGKQLLTTSVAETFKFLPLEQVFLETDDSEIEIEELYKAAAAIKNTDVASLCKQLTKNALRVFNLNFTTYDE